MFIMWTGRIRRTNAFGVFEPNKPVEVPEHIGRELRTVKLFVEVTGDGVVTPDSLDQLISVTPIVNDLLGEVHKLQEQNADLQLKLASAMGLPTSQEQKREPEAVVASVNLEKEDEELGYEPVQ